MTHLPVLYHQIIHALRPCDGGHYVDGTIGAGGHAKGILEASAPGGKLLGLDLDPQALELSQSHLALYGERVTIKRGSYAELEWHLSSIGWEAVDGILLDLGVSSMQLDTHDRGFSFRLDAPLDMRFDPRGKVTAEDLVNNLTEKELADLLYNFGEERKSRKIARVIVDERPIHTTFQLAELVLKAVGRSREKIHPATRTFQALRIATNRELDSIESVLPQAVNVLAKGGRLAVISFHSLEDRIVKRYFRQESKDCLCPPKQPICTCDHKARIKEISRRPIRPHEEEALENPRSRSSRLRVAEKL